MIGYKINNPEYFIINEILAIVGFSIYKTYFISESRVKKVDNFNMFCGEFRKLTLLLKHRRENELFRFWHLKRALNYFKNSRVYIDIVNNRLTWPKLIRGNIIIVLCFILIFYLVIMYIDWINFYKTKNKKIKSAQTPK